MPRKAQTEIKNQNIATKAPRHQEKYNLIYFVPLCLCGFLFFAGCEGKAKLPKAPKSSKPLVGVKSEQSEVSLKRENEKLKAENKQLKEQLETLMGIDKPARLEAVSAVSSIELTNRCGIYDKDSNDTGKKKTLVVYLRPIDDMGDCFKAAGAVKIELWNLNAKPAEALLSSWPIEPEKLKKRWSGSLLTSYYKLQFDVNSILGSKEKELTLKAEFTDYLTGKILRAQRVIKP
jgi:cell division protein FtsB